MNKQLRRLGAGLLACYLALFAMVNYVQVFHASALNEHPLNSRKIVRDFNRPRGQIISADGAVLAKTFPSYDPNLLATHDSKTTQDVKNFLEANGDAPLRGRAWQERFFPGSTFKVVTGSIGVESGAVTPDNPSFPVETQYKPPDGQPISNFGGESCGGALFDILRVSCNSAFATMGAEVIGQSQMDAGVRRFGFNTKMPIDLPNAATSSFPDTKKSKAFLGQASIGQFDTAASPLQMALVAGAVANNGTMMTPHVMKDVKDDNGKVLDTYDPKPWLTAMSPQTAATMRDAMRGVVHGGTGTAAQIDGVDIGGKTGTAQLGTTPATSEAGFIC